MTRSFVAVLFTGALAVAACGGQPAAPKTDAAAPAAAAKPEVAQADKPAAEKAEHAEGEDGCIYNEKHEAGHADGAHAAGHAAGGHAAGGHGEEGGGCGHDAAMGAGGGEAGHFGAAFAMAENKPLHEVLASGATPPAGPVQVTGQIDSVCQKAGCWMVIKDGDAKARILMKDHSFTVPMDSKGKAAVVEGTIEARTFNEKQVKHLEKDGGGDPAEVSGDRTEFVLTASGIKIANS